MLRLQGHRRLGQVRTVEPGAAVDVLGGHQRAPQRPDAAGMDRDVGAARELEDLAGIARGPLEADIAGDGDDPEQLDLLRRGQCQQDGDGIVLARIGVDDDLALHRFHPPLSAKPASRGRGAIS